MKISDVLCLREGIQSCSVDVKNNNLENVLWPWQEVVRFKGFELVSFSFNKVWASGLVWYGFILGSPLYSTSENRNRQK